MVSTPTDIRERTFDFAVRIIKLCQHLDKKPGVPRTLSYQLLKAEHQWEQMLKKRRLARADPILSARTL
jgi:hypothetical protein